jgi:GNAT superfamily N-acetyltransferase
VKGQRLFVREAVAGDESSLRDFYARASADPPELITEGVLARLVGDLVAHLTWTLDRNQATVTNVYVVEPLRRKRVGRSLIENAVSIARGRGITRLVVDGSCPLREFFLRMGFAERGRELVLEVS